MRRTRGWIVAAAFLVAACGVSKDKVLAPDGMAGGGAEAGMGGIGGDAGMSGEGGTAGTSQGGASGEAGASGNGGTSGKGGAGGATGGSAGTGGTAGGKDAGPDAPTPGCTDNTKNGNETDVDCGGGLCPECAGGKGCKAASDCASGVCTAASTCFDGTVFGIQSSATSTGCTVEANTTVQAGIKLAPVVVASSQLSVSTSLHGYYVHDPVGSWHSGSGAKFTGVLLVAPKTLATNFVAGDLISAIGDYKEYYCFTEFQVTSVSKIGADMVAPAAPVDATMFEYGGVSADVEPYEGVVVKLSNVDVTDDLGGTNPKWWFQVGAEIYVANEFNLTGFSPLNGTIVTSLSGAVKYSYLTWLISPRTDADIVAQ